MIYLTGKEILRGRHGLIGPTDSYYYAVPGLTSPCFVSKIWKHKGSSLHLLTAERNRAYGSRMGSCVGCGNGFPLKISSCFEGMPGPKDDMFTNGK